MTLKVCTTCREAKDMKCFEDKQWSCFDCSNGIKPKIYEPICYYEYLIVCECGSVITNNTQSHHRKSQKHKRLMNYKNQ